MKRIDSMTANIHVADQTVKAKTSAPPGGAALTEGPATPSMMLIMESSLKVNLLLIDRPSPESRTPRGARP